MAMIITGMHWFVATVVAVVVHLVGILWLSIASPERQPDVESASEGIVVALGRDAPTAAGSRDAPEPEAEAAIPAMEEVEPPPPDTTLDAMQQEEPAPEEPVAREPVPEAEPPAEELAAAEPEPAPTPEPSAADSTGPETLEARPLDEAASVDPESARAPEAVQAGSIEPESAESGQDADVAAVEARTVASEPVPESSPAAPETVAIEEAPARSEPTPGSAETPEAAAVEPSQAQVQPREAVPTEPADEAPLPGQSEPETAREIETADPEAAPAPETPAVELPRPGPTGEDVALVEEVETAPAEQSVPRTSDDADIDVAALRQPTPEVPAASEPEVTESAAPETVKLEELQQRSGGSGVVASYAGVLKGWLQRNMHYPRAARLAGQEGDVVIRFIIDRQGNVQSVELESGSGHSLLDREATEMVERGDPFPAMPEDMPGERLEVRVPISFEVREADRTRDLPPIYLE